MSVQPTLLSIHPLYHKFLETKTKKLDYFKRGEKKLMKLQEATGPHSRRSIAKKKKKKSFLPAFPLKMHHSWVLNDWGKSGFGNLASILSARNVKKKKKKRAPRKSEG